MDYHPGDKVQTLLEAMRKVPDRLWTNTECARTMGVPASATSAYLAAAIKAQVIFRGDAHSGVVYAPKQIPSFAPLPTAPPASSAPPAWCPAGMVAPRPGSEVNPARRDLPPPPTATPMPTPPPAMQRRARSPAELGVEMVRPPAATAPAATPAPPPPPRPSPIPTPPPATQPPRPPPPMPTAPTSRPTAAPRPADTVIPVFVPLLPIVPTPAPTPRAADAPTVPLCTCGDPEHLAAIAKRIAGLEFDVDMLAGMISGGKARGEPSEFDGFLSVTTGDLRLVGIVPEADGSIVISAARLATIKRWIAWGPAR